MDQLTFFDGVELEDRRYSILAPVLFLRCLRKKKKLVSYRDSTVIKTVDLSDKVAKRVFIVEMIEMAR